MRRVVAAVTAAVAVAGLVGCDLARSPADDETPDRVDGQALVVYEDDRLAFAHPEGWDVEVSDDDEQRVRVELREPGADHAQAVIAATWPVVAHWSLDTAVGHFGRAADEPEVSDFEQNEVEVPGAEEAVLQTFVATDGVPGEDIPARFWTVFAMAEVGRTMFLTVSALEDAGIDGEALAEAVIDSLVLKSPWGVRLDQDAAGREDPDRPGGDLDVYVAPAGRYSFVYPADWDHHATEGRFRARPPDAESPNLLVHRVDYEEPTVDAVVERMRAEIPVDPTVSEVDVPGAPDARRLAWRTGDLASEAVVAHHGEGFFVVLLLAWDTDDPPGPELAETIVGSLELAPDAAASGRVRTG